MLGKRLDMRRKKRIELVQAQTGNFLAMALKNDIEQVGQLVNYFDFAINEQCFEYNECAPLQAFIKRGKAVLGVEYELKKKKFCPQAKAMKFSWLKMSYDLKGERDAC